MSLTSPVLCNSCAFSFYCVIFFLILCICCHKTNQIYLMMSQRNWVWLRILWYVLILRFSLRFNYSVGSVSVLGSVVFAPTGVEFKGDTFASGVFVPTEVESKGGWLIKKKLALRFLNFFPNLKLRLCLTHSNRCSFTKNMIRGAPMDTICRPPGYGSGGTDTTAFV